jgi:hypothetical protein
MYGTRLLRRLVEAFRDNWTAAERTATAQGWQLTRGEHGSVTVRDPRIRAHAISSGHEVNASTRGWAA